MEYDNPAARLVAILEECKRRPKDSNCRAQWHEILRTNGTEAQLMTSLGKLMTLPQTIVDELLQHYQWHQIKSEHWMAKVNAAFASQQLHGAWQSFITHIDDHTISYLTHSAQMLNVKGLSQLIDADDLASWKEVLVKLIEEILASDQSRELKFFLVKNLNGVVGAIDDYRITGSMPIVQALDTTIGHCYFNAAYKDFIVNDPIGGKISTALQNIANVVTIATGYPQLVVPVTGALLAINRFIVNT